VWVARPDRLDLPCGVPTANSSDEGVGSYVSQIPSPVFTSHQAWACD
jgi:hypothetical protein